MFLLVHGLNGGSNFKRKICQKIKYKLNSPRKAELYEKIFGK
ncbi:unknown [Clostridium sp. CAG:571]|nr:unknown [Clostridium sp. CAG:571]